MSYIVENATKANIICKNRSNRQKAVFKPSYV